MSCSDSPRLTTTNGENQCKAGNGGTETKCAGADSSARERVIKEVGHTSASFIGPTLPPGRSAPKSSKIEDSLSQFYEELKEIDTPENSGKQPAGQQTAAPERSAGKHTQEKKRNSVETDSRWKSGGERPPSWTHWYHNEPYRPRRPRPGTDMTPAGMAPPQSQWHYPHSQDRPPPLQPRTHRPPPFHHPPPPFAFHPHPQYLPPPPPRMNPNWGYSANHYQEPAFSHMPNSYAPPNLGEYEDYPYYSNGDKQGHAYDAYSHNGSRDGEELCSPYVDDYQDRQRFAPQDEAWEQQHQQLPSDVPEAYHSPLMLMLMRGLPGSGKSTLARELLSTGPSGLILSTDDYFDHKKGYRYEPALLGVAHKWNQTRARDAMHNHRTPIIVDNTNIQAWEMKPYVIMALEQGYEVAFCEPATSWKLDPSELEKKNKHGVSQEKIAQMLSRFTFPISIDIVLNSQEPPHVQQRPPQPPLQPPPRIIWANRLLY